MMVLSEVEGYNVFHDTWVASANNVGISSMFSSHRNHAGGESKCRGQIHDQLLELRNEVVANTMGLHGVMTQNYYFSANQNAKRLHGVPL